MPSEHTTRHVSIRLSPTTRDRLDRVSTDADRPLAQIVRYAVIALLANTAPLGPLPDRTVDSTRHLGVRLPSPLYDQVVKTARRHHGTPSDILRLAIEQWLATSAPDALGRPASRTAAH
jgi:predicted DNA-binding protein